MKQKLNRVARFFIRISSFLGKEVFEVLRQPRLVFTLILGPFLILLLFGIGFRNQARALRTLFVAPEGSPLGQQIEEYAKTLGPQLIFVGVIDDQAEAMQQLVRGNVDVVVVTPDNAYEVVRNDEQAVFTLYHYEIDPFQVDYVNYFGEVYIDEVNRRVLQTITAEGQTEAATVQDTLESARQSAAAMREALEQGDAAQAREHQQSLNEDISLLAIATGATAGVLDSVQSTLGPDGQSETDDILVSLASLQENSDELNDIEQDRDNYDEDIRRVAEVEEDLARLESRLAEFQDISPNVLVSPFRSETKSVSDISLGVSDYFAPGVIVLLLQHLAVTFGALSIVREYRLGTMELFRVAPISAFEVLIGKYLSYFIFSGIITLVLTLLLLYGLGVPMLGTWYSYVLVIAALLFTSLGVGFVMSLLSETDSQAVQYSMIVLLTSVFFSGFFLSLETLWAPVRVVSWILPATYGIALLQNIMLRGHLANVILISGLTAIGVLMFFIAWWLLGRLMKRAV
jgi:ABC-2 type transport system permease protein